MVTRLLIRYLRADQLRTRCDVSASAVTRDVVMIRAILVKFTVAPSRYNRDDVPGITAVPTPNANHLSLFFPSLPPSLPLAYTVGINVLLCDAGYARVHRPELYGSTATGERSDEGACSRLVLEGNTACFFSIVYLFLRTNVSGSGRGRGDTQLLLALVILPWPAPPFRD